MKSIRIPVFLLGCWLILVGGNARALPPYTTGLQLALDAGAGVYKDAAKTQAATTAGDQVYTWADQSGNGNDCIQATSANRPTYQPNILNSLPIVRCAGSHYLANAGFTGSTQSETIVIVYRPNARCAQQYLTAQGSTFYTSQNTGQPSFYDTSTHGVAYGSIGISREFQLLTVVASASSVVFRQNGWNVTSLAAAAANTPTGITLFHLPGYTGYDLNGDVAEVLVYNAALSGANLTSVENYLLAKYAIPAPLSTAMPLVVVEGDSLSQGINTASNTQEYPEIAYQGANGASPYNYRNFAVSGSKISDLTNRAAQIDALYSANRAKNILYVWIGTNDLSGGATPTTVYNNLVAYCQARRAVGWKVIVRTTISRTGFSTQRTSYNSLIRANWQTFADGLDDLGSDVLLGADTAYSNTAYYSADGTHLTPAGYAVAATYAGAAITKITGVIAPYKPSRQAPRNSRN